MKFASIALLASLAATAACTDETDEDTSEREQSIVDNNALSFNRIATNRIATNRIATNRIATNRIAGNRFALDEQNAGELLTTPEGRELLTYIVGCALSTEQTVEGEHLGITYTFHGDIGLARTWVNHSLNGSDQRWVSACLLSRVNAHGISLLVSLRGPNPHLKMAAGEAEAYSVEEGSFYGNVFGPADEPLIAYACRGLDQAMGEPGPGAPLADRDCAEPSDADPTRSQCDFAFVGNCAEFGLDAMLPDDDDDDDHDHGHGHGHGYGHHHHNGCGWGHDHDHDSVVEPHACESQANTGDFYRRCHTEVSSVHGHFAPHTKYNEVITVFLQP